MQNPVVIKGNKAGMTVYLDPALPFTELLEAVKKKFRETARFWGSAQMTLTLEGRRLSPEEEFSVVNAITENSRDRDPVPHRRGCGTDRQVREGVK